MFLKILAGFWCEQVRIYFLKISSPILEVTR
jgi:hypothetical protein